MFCLQYFPYSLICMIFCLNYLMLCTFVYKFVLNMKILAFPCQCHNPWLRTVPLLEKTKCHLCKKCRSSCFELSSMLHKSKKTNEFMGSLVCMTFKYNTEKTKRHQKLLVFVFYPKFLKPSSPVVQRPRG